MAATAAGRTAQRSKGAPAGMSCGGAAGRAGVEHGEPVWSGEGIR
uniref:Uncharacterized protein n=1 Tax=Arundo donax TaxID=35708 RepID=A0A0A9HJG7_ARUDO